MLAVREEAMKISEQIRKGQYHTIYKELLKTPRIYYQDLAEFVGINWKTVKKRLEEAIIQQCIVGPQLRKRSYKNLKEYVYFVNCKNPIMTYSRYRKDPNVIYHAKATGFCNLFLITTKEIDIDGIILEGYRSDYHVSHAPNHSWETALKKMQKMIEAFDPTAHFRKNIVKSRLEDAIEWDHQDEIMYRYFKYNLRNLIQPLMKEHKITGWKIYQFLNRLRETCTVFTDFYPDGLLSYDPYLFMFETDYEDFIIDLFSELPSTASFFKVADRVFSLFHVPKQLIRTKDPQRASNRMYIPLLVIDLLDKGILESEDYTIVEYSWAKDL